MARMSKAPSQRQLRVGELLRRRLCEIFARDGLYSADMDTRLITVTQVTATPDLRRAIAYIMPLGGGKSGGKSGGKGGSDAAGFVDALNAAAPQLQTQMSKGLRLKYVPQLVFKIDDSFDNADKMARLLQRDDVARDLKKESNDGTA